jgi:hypothetical protein
MTMRITMTQTRMGEAGSLLVAASTYTVSKAFGRAMVWQGFATDTDGVMVETPSSLTPAELPAVRALVSGERISDTSSRDITADDNARTLAPTGTLTYTIPAGLSPMPSFTIDCPASGTITVAVSGGATLNGGFTPATRIRAANPVGFIVLAHSETDSYGISGT